LWIILKDEAYETSPHTLEELGKNKAREISTRSGKELQRFNNMFCRYTEGIRSGGKQF
jgi:hypothetical protein